MEQFNLYKQMEEKLETIPTVKVEVHFELNDVAQKILNGESLSGQEIDSLELIYEELQDLEKDLVNILDTYRAEGLITKDECLLIVSYFLVAYQHGPESTELKKIFEENLTDGVMLENTLTTISIPEHTKKLLAHVHRKVSIVV